MKSTYSLKELSKTSEAKRAEKIEKKSNKLEKKIMKFYDEIEKEINKASEGTGKNFKMMLQEIYGNAYQATEGIYGMQTTYKDAVINGVENYIKK